MREKREKIHSITRRMGESQIRNPINIPGTLFSQDENLSTELREGAKKSRWMPAFLVFSFLLFSVQCRPFEGAAVCRCPTWAGEREFSRVVGSRLAHA